MLVAAKAPASQLGARRKGVHWETAWESVGGTLAAKSIAAKKENLDEDAWDEQAFWDPYLPADKDFQSFSSKAETTLSEEELKAEEDEGNTGDGEEFEDDVSLAYSVIQEEPVDLIEDLTPEKPVAVEATVEQSRASRVRPMKRASPTIRESIKTHENMQRDEKRICWDSRARLKAMGVPEAELRDEVKPRLPTPLCSLDQITHADQSDWRPGQGLKPLPPRKFIRSSPTELGKGKDKGKGEHFKGKRKGRYHHSKANDKGSDQGSGCQINWRPFGRPLQAPPPPPPMRAPPLHLPSTRLITPQPMYPPLPMYSPPPQYPPKQCVPAPRPQYVAIQQQPEAPPRPQCIVTSNSLRRFLDGNIL